MSQIKYLKIEQLEIPSFDGRLESDPEYDQELAASIKELGVMQPIIVRKIDNHYEIIFGSCRYRASKIAGLDSMPCIVVKSDDELAEKMKLHENLKRLPLSHVDQAVSFARFITEFGMTEAQISTISGKSVPYISQHICLLDSGEEIISSVQTKKINFSVARELMKVKNEDTKAHLLKHAIIGGASVDTVKNWVNEASNENDYYNRLQTASDSEPPPPKFFTINFSMSYL